MSFLLILNSVFVDNGLWETKISAPSGERDRERGRKRKSERQTYRERGTDIKTVEKEKKQGGRERYIERGRKRERGKRSRIARGGGGIRGGN